MTNSHSHQAGVSRDTPAARDNCDHYHFPQSVESPRDNIIRLINVPRYGSNFVQAGRAFVGGANFAGRLLDSNVSVASAISPVALVLSLPLFVVNHLLHQRINYEAHRDVYDITFNLRNNEVDPREHHSHLPQVAQALFHLPDTVLGFLANNFTPSNHEAFTRNKKALFYIASGLVIATTAVGIAAVSGTGIGLAVTVPIAVATATALIAYNVYKNRYTQLNREVVTHNYWLREDVAADQGFLLIEDEAMKKLLTKMKENNVFPSFSQWLRGIKPDYNLSQLTIANQVLAFLASSQLQPQQKQEIVNDLLRKFQPRDDLSGYVVDGDKKIPTDLSSFAWQMQAFVLQKELDEVSKTITNQAEFNKFKKCIDDKFPLELPRNRFSRCLGLGNNFAFYPHRVLALELQLSALRKLEIKPVASCSCCGHGEGHGDSNGHGDYNGHGHSHGHGHSNLDFKNYADHILEQPSLLDSVPSRQSPHLWSGNYYLNGLGRLLAWCLNDSQSYRSLAVYQKLTPQGIRELVAKTRESFDKSIDKSKESRSVPRDSDWDDLCAPDEDRVNTITINVTEPKKQLPRSPDPVIEAVGVEGWGCFCCR